MRLVGVALAAAVGSLGWASAEGPARRPGVTGTGASANTAATIKAAVEEHVARVAQESGGVYRVADAYSGKTLELELVSVGVVAAGSLWRVHDPDSRVEGGAFFACTRFHLVGAPDGKVYDIDMQIERGEGGLAVTAERIHQEKQLVNGEWVWVVRPKDQAASAKRPVTADPR
jgi:hypothetical protein